jgi:hypothetical protein
VESGQTTYVQELLRDAGFLLMAGWLIARPHTLVALDDRLESRRS